MKKQHTRTWVSMIALVLVLSLTYIMFSSAVMAEVEAPGVPGDNNPAIMVTQKTANSVVGVITSKTTWTRQRGESETMMGEGSGVVIKPGYVLTNNHVIEGGSTYQVLLPSGEYADATLVGSDASTDLAVLKVDSDELVPVEIGSSSNLLVGSTVIAIGNPGGTVLASTVTSGIVSALERTSVNANNSTRTISYIQHDAAINNGNSGGGLFNINGQLIGINTLKYYGSVYSSMKFEGLGFAIPVDMIYPIAEDLIQYGKVQRPQMGVMVATFEGPEKPTSDYPPASVAIASITPNSPAQRAGLRPYDFITEIDGQRVVSLAELTTLLDQHKVGDTVTLTIVRYANAVGMTPITENTQSTLPDENYGGNYGDYLNPFGNYFDTQPSTPTTPTHPTGSFETLQIPITLEILG